jgi:hypothetical protein
MTTQHRCAAPPQFCFQPLLHPLLSKKYIQPNNNCFKNTLQFKNILIYQNHQVMTDLQQVTETKDVENNETWMIIFDGTNMSEKEQSDEKVRLSKKHNIDERKVVPSFRVHRGDCRELKFQS